MRQVLDGIRQCHEYKLKLISHVYVVLVRDSDGPVTVPATQAAGVEWASVFPHSDVPIGGFYCSTFP